MNNPFRQMITQHQSPSTPTMPSQPTDDVDMDIYANDSSESDFDFLAEEGDMPIPKHFPGSTEANPPPKYSETLQSKPASPSSSFKSEGLPPPLPPTTSSKSASSTHPFQTEEHPLLRNSHNRPSDQGNQSRPLEAPPLFPPVVPNQRAICVICQQRTVYNDGSTHVYPTCGNTCAQKFEAMSVPVPSSARIVQGQLANPRASQPSFLSSLWQSQNQPQRTSNQIKMCEVCRVRPKCQRGGKIYPTCGLTCAAKLQPGKVEMCDFCKKRPKAIVNGRMFPQCGKTCRDNAKIAITAAANSATCTTCIVCWRAPRMGESSDYCSNVCEVAAENRAPFLIELPRGHASFRKVADVYINDWKHTRNPIPRIKKIYMVKVKDSTLKNYEKYRSGVNSHTVFRKKGNEQHAWLGVPRECGFGDPGNIEPCSSIQCHLCCIIKSTATPDMLTNGIPTSTLLHRAVDKASNTRRRVSKVVLMARVLYGNMVERVDLAPPLPPAGFDSVHLVTYTRSGTRMDFQEKVVFDNDAIQPQYLIAFE